jgi:hypothetical protein
MHVAVWQWRGMTRQAIATLAILDEIPATNRVTRSGGERLWNSAVKDVIRRIQSRLCLVAIRIQGRRSQEDQQENHP